MVYLNRKSDDLSFLDNFSYKIAFLNSLILISRLGNPPTSSSNILLITYNTRLGLQLSSFIVIDFWLFNKKTRYRCRKRIMTILKLIPIVSMAQWPSLSNVIIGLFLHRQIKLKIIIDRKKVFISLFRLLCYDVFETCDCDCDGNANIERG